MKKWLLNYARNANKPTPVAFAITTKKVNAPRRLASMRLLKQPTSHQKTRRMQVRYDPKQVSGPDDKGARKITRSPLVVVVPGILILKEVSNNSRRIGTSPCVFADCFLVGVVHSRSGREAIRSERSCDSRHRDCRQIAGRVRVPNRTLDRPTPPLGKG